MFKRFGIKVVRITTKDIRNRNYKEFKNEFIGIYKTNKEKIEQYYGYLDINQKQYDVQIKLTSIIRLQVLILELLDRGVLSLDNKIWDFNVYGKNISDSFELAIKDLELWIGHIAALFNLSINLPHINIT